MKLLGKKLSLNRKIIYINGKQCLQLDNEPCSTAEVIPYEKRHIWKIKVDVNSGRLFYVCDNLHLIVLAVTDPNIKNFSFNFDEKNPKIISTSPEINYYSDTFRPVIYPYLSRVDNLQKDTEISLPTIPNKYQHSWELRKINNYTDSSKPFICFREPYKTIRKKFFIILKNTNSRK